MMMQALTTLFVLSLPLAGLAGAQSRTSRLSSRQPEIQSRNNRVFKLEDMYQGKTFFDGWDFFTGPDPTHGAVNFLNKDDAFAKGLAFVQEDNTTVMAVDSTTVLPVGTNRNSVRIGSTKKYTGGLFIADIFAMPHGCSVWPAWWSVGDNWPQNGEIDVIEGVNDQKTNQMTLHTSEGCTLDRQVQPDIKNNINIATSSKVIGTQCASSGNNNNGCAFDDANPASHGHGFNVLGGGVYAHLWEDSSIKIWHFPRGQIPQDIDAKNPDPSTWPSPAAQFTSDSCDIRDHFRDHQLVFDITLCGDFAGAQYPQSGCPGTCAQAVADPKNFKFAQWKINYVAVYN